MNLFFKPPQNVHLHHSMPSQRQMTGKRFMRNEDGADITNETPKMGKGSKTNTPVNRDTLLEDLILIFGKEKASALLEKMKSATTSARDSELFLLSTERHSPDDMISDEFEMELREKYPDVFGTKPGQIDAEREFLNMTKKRYPDDMISDELETEIRAKGVRRRDEKVMSLIGKAKSLALKLKSGQASDTEKQTLERMRGEITYLIKKNPDMLCVE
jgi:hypothetical protein